MRCIATQSFIFHPNTASGASPRQPSPVSHPRIASALPPHHRHHNQLVISVASTRGNLAPFQRAALPDPHQAPVTPPPSSAHLGRAPTSPEPISTTITTTSTNPTNTGDLYEPFHCSKHDDRWLELLALDVEYTHVQLPDGSRQSLATWVCLVDRFGGVPLKSYAALPDSEGGDGKEGQLPAGTRIVGGVPRAALVAAPPLSRVREMVLELLCSGGCRVLVGHGLTKDLRALGIGERVATALRRRHGVRLYDTMSFSKFRGRGGTARSLARLAAEFLDGRRIQNGTAAAGAKGAGGGSAGGRHDPEEDARAVLDLYVRYVDYSYMVEYETARMLEEYRRRSSSSSGSATATAEEEAAATMEDAAHVRRADDGDSGAAGLDSAP
ncbi:hypothetical protein VOLCADRAFT_94404 [Volvox carteri f. nagariensis]|uniref:Exonuclease domain-containing protein n=1 Tax=Volvox carteri f. nagariensis TaxID=3068 RepID=D8U4P8_VOLCA|nr:uncharacterized protein VOLCADRAFT_94404 [Volvox carteri f. nagariensis]EFJ45313.1 hypothetical protein VOLCADRAFT_94404 [Volvox carteri f. nagariensis]|eukprot:XP_002953689.1 hypothetical protein VOLCADRAFT_94404 [Volvox carteri f. nagariensis]